MDDFTIETIKIWLLNKVPLFAIKIAPIYSVLNWRWDFDNGNIKVPTSEEIKNCLEKTIEKFFKDYQNNLFGDADSGFYNSGGLMVGFTKEEEDITRFFISFSMEENVFSDEVEEEFEL